jgi:hypothetical protein
MGGRSDRFNDTMIGGHGAGQTRVHGSHLADKPSATVPKGGTLTLEEWRAQQEAK